VLDIPDLLANKSEAQLKAALEHLLAAHILPVFSAARQVEHEVAALRAVKTLGAPPDNADEYTLVTSLRITKAKTRHLLYQDALRTLTSPQQIDDALRALVVQPAATKDGDLIILEVPQPFLMDALRRRVRQFGFLSDCGTKALKATIFRALFLILGLIKTAGRATAGGAGEHLGAAIAEGTGSALAHGTQAAAKLKSS
jgi:hypothetical protein